MEQSSRTAAPIRLPKLEARWLLRALLSLVVALALWYALRSTYDRVLVRAGAEILSRSAEIPAADLIVERDGQYAVDTGLVRQSGKPVYRGLGGLHAVHWNWILFLWACGLIPLRHWRRVWWVVGLATFALAVTHVAYFTVATFGQIASLHREHGRDLISPGSLRWLTVGVQSWSVLLDKIVPLALLAPAVWLGRRRSAARPAVATRRLANGQKVGRNEPCPCGSGRKFKRCCG